jgi:yeast amino acid transporter
MTAPLLMGYIAMSTVVYFVMNMLGEMTTYLPVRGVSVPYLINRFTEPSLGFAVGTSVQFPFSRIAINMMFQDIIIGIHFQC